MWLLFSILSAITAALVAIFGKLGLQKIDTTLATTIRSTIMAAALIILSLSLKKFSGFSLHDLAGRQWTYIVFAGLAGAASWLFYFAALKLGLATKVAALDRTSIVFVVIFSALFLGEALTWKAALGAVFMVGGAILLAVR